MKPQSNIQDPAILQRIDLCKLIAKSALNTDHKGSSVIFSSILDELETMVSREEFEHFCEVELLQD